MKTNLKLWNEVEKTNPDYTKRANVKGNKITAIAPQYQLKQATEQWGAYGISWGLRNVEFDFSLVDKTGLATMKGEFYFPEGSFPALNSISVWRDGEMKKPDDQFIKKMETDCLTKCLSKLGFNADIFLGRFDDSRYVEELKKEFKEKSPEYQNLKNKRIEAISLIDTCTLLKDDAQKEKKRNQIMKMPLHEVRNQIDILLDNQAA